MQFSLTDSLNAHLNDEMLKHGNELYEQVCEMFYKGSEQVCIKLLSDKQLESFKNLIDDEIQYRKEKQ